MNWWQRLRQKDQLENELDAELRFHFERQVEDKVRAGMSEDEARRTTRLEFGGLEQVREECRDARGTLWVENAVQDVRFALRTLRKNPGFAMVAVCTLALGIGATAAVFSVVDGVLLRPLPYRDPERLAFAWTKLAWIGVPRAWISGRHIAQLQDETRRIESFVVTRVRDSQLTGLAEPEQIRVGHTTTNLFDVLGVRPEMGRAFRPEEARQGSENVVILGHAIWQQRFGGDRGVIGRKITVGGQSVEVVGVMPPHFRFLVHSSLGDPAEPDLWAPGTWAFRGMPEGQFQFALLVRVRPGVTLAQAQAELDGIGSRVDRERYNGRGFGWQLVGVQDDLVRKARPALLVLLGAAGLVLLIVCANVASLHLVRAAGRDREFAVRCAVGAGRGRIVRQLLAESLTLALLGGALGYGLAYAGVEGLLTLPGIQVPRLYDVAVDGRVLLFTLLTALVSGVTFGLAPALRCSRPELSESLKEGARGCGSARGHRLRATFVLGEIAVALVLLAGAALLLRTFAALRSVDPGFEPSGVLTARITLPAAKYPGGQGAPGFVRRVVQRIKDLPGVRAAAATNATPLSRKTDQMDSAPEGSVPDRQLLVDRLQITPDYFAAMGIRTLAGREFSWQDNAQSDQILIVDEVFARLAWPNQSPIGKYVQLDGRKRVVGVVRQPRLYEVQRDDRPQVFVPYTQSANLGVTLVVRADAPARLAWAVRQAVWSEDKAQPVGSIRLMQDIVGESLSDRSLSMFLLAIFAAVALLLASLGVYGVVAYVVGQRTREIGIRMALGAKMADIRRMVVGQALRLAFLGVALGLLGAFAFGRILTSQLYAVSPSDPLTLAGAALALVLVALASGYLPALRASRIDPAVALRGE